MSDKQAAQIGLILALLASFGLGILFGALLVGGRY